MNSFDRNNPNEYYFFDDNAQEVVIKRYDSPSPWMNYFSKGLPRFKQSNPSLVRAFCRYKIHIHSILCTFCKVQLRVVRLQLIQQRLGCRDVFP